MTPMLTRQQLRQLCDRPDAPVLPPEPRDAGLTAAIAEFVAAMDAAKAGDPEDVVDMQSWAAVSLYQKLTQLGICGATTTGATHEPPHTGWHFDGDRVIDDFTGAVIGFVAPRCSDSGRVLTDPAHARLRGPK